MGGARTMMLMLMMAVAAAALGPERGAKKTVSALTFFPAVGYEGRAPGAAYASLHAALSGEFGLNVSSNSEHNEGSVAGARDDAVAQRARTNELCIAHNAFDAMLSLPPHRCGAGAVLIGAAPAADAVRQFASTRPVLFVSGTRDGVTRFPRVAVLRHVMQEQYAHANVRFAVIEGLAHHVGDGQAPTKHIHSLDLRPTMTPQRAASEIVALARTWLDAPPSSSLSTTSTWTCSTCGHVYDADKDGGGVAFADLPDSWTCPICGAPKSAYVATTIEGETKYVHKEHASSTSSVLADAEALAAKMAQPLIDALKLEGSNQLGNPWCDSDFPTNPSCQYPKYPDFSLPFGPAPAPSPPLPATCVCGSEWVATVGNSVIAGDESQSFTVFAKDAFHDVSDTHPFHLPNIWNKCDSPDGCTLNMTTLTMPILKAGDLFPDNATVSAYEMRAKIKSRQVIWEAAGLGKQDKDANLTFCQTINEKAYAWALQHAEPSVRSQFEANGEPLVMVPDQNAKIGATGPQWIQDELVYTRVNSTSPSRVEIQSWTFVVGDSPVHSKIIPSGMHYCKLLSPARAMEWIYLDGLRNKLSL